MGKLRLVTVSTVAASLIALGCGSTATDDDRAEPIDITTSPPTTVEPASESRDPTPVVIGRVPDSLGAGTRRSVAFFAATDPSATDALPEPPRSDVGYVFDVTEPPSPSVVAELADVFGVEGEMIDQRSNGRLFRIGDDNGFGPAVLVETGPDLRWTFHWAWEDAEDVSCRIRGGPPPVQGFRRPAGEQACPERGPTPGVPDAERSIELALDLLDRLGADTGAVEYSVRESEHSAQVMAWDDSTPLGRASTWSFDFGADGQLIRAEGALRAPTPVGPFPLIDREAALERLTGGGDGHPIRIGGRALDEFDVDDWTAPSPNAALPLPRLVDVKPDLWEVVDRDGVRWLLPAYRFIDEFGGWYTVPAITDQFVVNDDM